MSIGNALLLSLLGMSIVMFALALLCVLIILLTKCMARISSSHEPKNSDIPAENPLSVANAVKVDPFMPSSGSVDLYDVPDASAAMIMAIVAHHLDKPLCELRFCSIKEIHPQEEKIS